jgi:hypothetical protein
MKTLLLALAFWLFASPVMAQTYWRATALGAPAGQFAHIQLWNPPDSGIYCTVTLLTVGGSSSAAAVGYGDDPIANVPYAIPNGIKTEVSEGTFGKCYLRTSVGIAENIGQLVNHNVPFVLNPIRLVIAPGHGIIVRSSNKDIRASFAWEETTTLY